MIAARSRTAALALRAVTGAAFTLIVAAVLASAPARAETKIQSIVTPGGVEAWLVEEYAIPIVSIEIGVRGGAALESAEEAGVSGLLASMMSKGAGDLDSTAFAARADELAARVGFSAGRDSFTISATMLRDQRDASLELLHLALTEPRFDEEPMARVKAQIESSIRQRSVDPSTLAGEAWYAAMFPGDPYGRPSIGTSETIAALTDDDLRAAMPRFINVENMEIGVVGAISAEELGPILDALLDGVAADAPAAPPTLTPATPSGVTVVPFEAPQSTVVFGHSGLTRDDPDFIPAYVMNYVLGGGGFASRLTIEVREKRGLAYGVYSYLAPFDRTGLYLGGVATANERVGESIALIRAEWARLATEGVTAEELENAKRYLTGAFPLRFDSNAKIAGFLVGAQLDDLGIDYITRRNGLIEAVTEEDIRRVAARVLQPDALYFVVAGQPVGLETKAD